jgi:hypothetical protein
MTNGWIDLPTTYGYWWVVCNDEFGTYKQVACVHGSKQVVANLSGRTSSNYSIYDKRFGPWMKRDEDQATWMRSSEAPI